MISRYIQLMCWNEIVKELGSSKPTVMRWHMDILSRLAVPEHPINVSEIPERAGITINNALR